MQVQDLQPDPDKIVRIVTKRGHVGTGVQYLDGIVREVTSANADENLYAVKLYSPTYNRESTEYAYGTDEVTEATRTAAPANTERSYEDRWRAFDREGFNLPPENK
ncbi:hypothetical protein OG436_16395 [Streptomyces caniferus]|uniref:Uncharacterized protein n=1 Tax=Streptomyces caniferus TaxID=285557 RepID=A0A640SGG0_9ACTN|nr:hypothetical protein [Streptomyces caniferus]GFE10503.1 hypothetical protein Scani_67710 [Streptomyces caniferus]